MGTNRLKKFESGTFKYQLSQAICVDPNEKCFASTDHTIQGRSTSSPDSLDVRTTYESVASDKPIALDEHDRYILRTDGTRFARVRGRSCWNAIGIERFPTLLEEIVDQGIQVLHQAVINDPQRPAVSAGFPFGAKVNARVLLRAARIFAADTVPNPDLLVPIEVTVSGDGQTLGFSASGADVYPAMIKANPELTNSEAAPHIRGFSLTFQVHREPINPPKAPEVCS